MSSFTAVSIMTGPQRRTDLMTALTAWAAQRDRSADFAMLEGRLAADAHVIVGQVNHLYLLDGLESLKAVIRDAVEEPGWSVWNPTGLTLLDDGGEVAPSFCLLDDTGTWSG